MIVFCCMAWVLFHFHIVCNVERGEGLKVMVRLMDGMFGMLDVGDCHLWDDQRICCRRQTAGVSVVDDVRW